MVFYPFTLLLARIFALFLALALVATSAPTSTADFSPVYQQTAFNGIGGYNLRSTADLLFAFDYTHSGKLDHLALYRPGTGTFWILHNSNGTFNPVYNQGDPGIGIAGYDLKSPADRAFAFDYDRSGKLDYIALYRPGTGTIWIIRNSAGVYTPVYRQGDPGIGIGGYDLKSPDDNVYALDYDHSGKTDYLALYRPGTGTFWILRNDNGVFTPVYREGAPGKGIGGYDLLSTADRSFAFDYDHSGKLDHIVLYRPGTGTIWILRNSGGVFTPVYRQGDPGSGIGGYDLKSPADRVFAYDYDHSGKLDHLVLYRPGTGMFWILRNDNGAFTPVFQNKEGVRGFGIGGFDMLSAADRAFPFDYVSGGEQSSLALYRPGTGMISILASKLSTTGGTNPSAPSKDGSDSSLPDTSPKTRSSSSLGPAIGGSLGGIAFIGIIIFAIFYFRRRRARRSGARIVDMEPKDDPFAPTHPTPAVQSDPPPSTPQYASYVPSASSLPYAASGRTASVIAESPPATPAAASIPYNTHVRDTMDSSRLQFEYPTTPTSSEPSSFPVRQLHSSPLHAITKGAATFQVANPTETAAEASGSGRPMNAEEAAFLHNLYSLNVPAEEIATMMEVMRAGRQDPTTGLDRGSVSVKSAVVGNPVSVYEEAPPQYEPSRN